MIIDLLANYAQQTMTIIEVADRLGMEKNNVKQLLHKMKHDGEVITPKKGHYALPDYSERQYEDNLDNCDNHP